MKKYFFLAFTIFLLLISTGCTKGEKGDDGNDGLSAFEIYKKYHPDYAKTESEWIETLKGNPGQNGEDGLSAYEIYKQNNPNYSGTEQEWIASLFGKDGITPTIGENGNWWIGTIDTGVIVSPPEPETSNATSGLHFELCIDGDIVGYEVVSYNGTSTEVNIPNYIKGIPVISISQNAFDQNITIISVHIPENIKSIGQFKSCTNLQEVIFDENSTITTIPSYAFYECQNLSRIELPNTVTSIGEYAFFKNYTLNYINFPDNLEIIGNNAFNFCVSLNKIIIPKSVTTIGNDAFYLDENFSSIYMEASSISTTWSSSWTDREPSQLHFNVKVENDYVYNYTLDNKIRIVGYLGSNEIIELPSILAETTVTTIGSFSFANNKDIIGMEIPNSVQIIESSAFVNCTNLRYTIIPASVIVIQGPIFLNPTEPLKNKTYCEVSSKPTGWVNDWAFYIDDFGTSLNDYYCFWSVKPTSVNLYEDLQYFVENEQVTIVGLTADVTSITIPATINNRPVTKIAKYAFMSNTELTEVSLPQGLLEISKFAFYGNSKLVKINIPTTVQVIGEYAFTYCSMLPSVYLPDSVIIIGYYSFEDCGNLIVITKFAKKPTGWDANWINEFKTIYWNVDQANYIVEGNYIGLLSGGYVKIIRYSVFNETLIRIPKTMKGYTVNCIAGYTIRTSISHVKIVIPDTITTIEQYGIYNIGDITYIYCEATSQPTGWNSLWFYDYTECITYAYWKNQWGYSQDGIPFLYS